MSARRLVALGTLWLSLTAAAAHATPDFTGKWAPVRAQREIRQLDGQPPPLLPAARAAKATSRGDADPVLRCLPPGLPRLHGVAQPFLILQRPKQLLVAYQFQRLVRQVFMQGFGPRDPDPAFLGNSIARWQGEALVVETTGFKNAGWLDEAGTPYSTALRLTENWQLRNRNTLEITVSIDDPHNHASPWQTRYTFRRQRGTELAEDVCADRTWPERVRQQQRMEQEP